MTTKKITIDQRDGHSYINIGKPDATPLTHEPETPETPETPADQKYCYICNKALLRTTMEKHISTKAHQTKKNKNNFI